MQQLSFDLIRNKRCVYCCQRQRLCRNLFLTGCIIVKLFNWKVVDECKLLLHYLDAVLIYCMTDEHSFAWVPP